MRPALASALLWIAWNLFSVALAEPRCERSVARAVSLEGRVEVRRAGSVDWRPVTLGAPYCHGDRFRVRADSRAALELANDTILRLDQKTTLILPEAPPERGFWVELVEGALHLLSRVRQGLEIRTPFVNAGLEGTEFVIRVLEAETLISVLEGRVAFENPHGRLALGPGQSASAARGQAPVIRLDIRPEDAVHWALHYPAVLDRPDGKLARAQGALAAGRVEQAEALLADADDAEELALRSVVALAQNDGAAAEVDARRALRLDPGSAAARLALSYALQARFDLPGARDQVEAALDADPDNALARARLAELAVALGDLEGGLQAAERAAALRPELARTRAVLGFARLIRFELQAARAAFEEAIRLDSGDPLPRLGLGLTKIRAGELAAGRRELEIAASLDPGNSLTRSYLGKAYFQEHRIGVARDELELAKDLDPNDPTPWLYQAILEQSENRPMAALEAMEGSIERNDNRAVTRSEFALDQDLAVRTAAKARIYRELGFDQLALRRGRQAVAEDPGDYAAHRFLADAYAALPRHEIARVSELYQSQMLQPLNINLIQPQLAVSDLGLIRGTGPSAPSFSELTPLFLSEGTYFQSNLLLGGFDTEGLDTLFAGLHGRNAYSLGHFYYKTDGFNTNNDQAQSLFNGLFQRRLTDRTSVQAEVSVRREDEGEPIRFDRSNVSPTRREITETRRVRLGARHDLAPGSLLLGAVSWQEEDMEVNQRSGFFTFSRLSDIKSANVELRYLYEAEYWNVTGGLSYWATDSEEQAFLNSPFGRVILSNRKPTERVTTAYLYSNLAVLENFELTGGLSTEHYDGEPFADEWLNGKLGVVWQLTPSTQLRSAFIQNATKRVVGNQTLEPTQVAGFNQFFDDHPGTRARRVGVALDQSFGRRLFGGLEWSERELDFPFLQSSQPAGAPAVARRVELDERLGRAYLYWLASDRLAVSLTYSYEDLDNSNLRLLGGENKLVEATTHRVPLELNYSHESPLSARLRATYVQQSGEFGSVSGGPNVRDRDEFWVFDASLDYRLPRRSGIVSIGVENLFDEEFSFQDTDPASPTIVPRQFVYARLSLSF